MLRSELFNLLMDQRGAFACTLYSKTEPKMRKRNNPYAGNVQKLSVVNGMLNWHYGNAVNNRRAIEEHPEPFTPAPRQWGYRLTRNDNTLTPFVCHKGNFYLELKVQCVVSTAYETLEGLPIELQLIQPHLLGPAPARRQELEQQVILRDYRFDHVCGIQMNEELHTITD